MSELDDIQEFARVAHVLGTVLSVESGREIFVGMHYAYRSNYYLRDQEGNRYRVGKDWKELQKLLTPSGLEMIMEGDKTKWSESFAHEVRDAIEMARIQSRNERV